MCDIAMLKRICLIAKQFECPLIVFVDTGDDVSAEMADELEKLDLLAKGSICKILTTPKLVAVRICQGSESYQYFCDIYGPVHHSSTFFIKSTTGEVLRVWNGREQVPTESATVSDLKRGQSPPTSLFEPSALRRRNEEDAVLQLRSPDGSATTLTFPRGATLAVVRDAMVQRLRLSPGSISLVNPYPRYEFSETDYRRTLEDLRLWPNAALFISLNSEATSPKPWTEPFSAVFGHILNLFTSLWALVRTAFNLERNRNEDRPEGNPPKRRKRQGPRIQSRRNVHSLHDDDSSSDDNATYNGNSTQQQ